MKTSLAFFVLAAAATAQSPRKPGAPLDALPSRFHRLAFFSGHIGWKASIPVVSSDGRFMAFQVAHTSGDAGVNSAIMLHRLKQ